MKTNFLVLFILLITISNLVGQRLEFGIGGNRNQFWSFENETNNVRYINDSGLNLTIGLCDLFPNKDGKKAFDIFLLFEQTSGAVSIAHIAKGSSSSTYLRARRYHLGIELSMFKLSLLNKRLRVKLGPEFSWMISYQLEGYSSISTIEPSYEYIEYDNSDSDFLPALRIGLNLTIGYEFELKSGMKIKPQYAYSLGLTRQFYDIISRAKNMIHRFQILLIKDI